jgi:hypothetical protein
VAAGAGERPSAGSGGARCGTRPRRIRGNRALVEGAHGSTRTRGDDARPGGYRERLCRGSGIGDAQEDGDLHRAGRAGWRYRHRRSTAGHQRLARRRCAAGARTALTVPTSLRPQPWRFYVR